MKRNVKGKASPLSDPDAALNLLAGNERPVLFGVRHHSPACAASITAVLEAVKPEVVLIELPVEFDDWLPWLGHEEASAPLALAGGRPGHDDLFFYPFADFSPELAAVRWAIAREVPVRSIDRPVLARGTRCLASAWQIDGDEEELSEAARLLQQLLRNFGVGDTEELWDRMVEARAPGATADQIRRAALLSGWAMRIDAACGEGIDREDLLRERFMRQHILTCAEGRKSVAVIGAFHAAALLPEPLLFDRELLTAAPEPPGNGKLATSLIPYAFDLLDSRSGYPAGIRDPAWQQNVLELLGRQKDTEALVDDVVVAVCRRLRERGHVAGPPDAKEAVRIARDLSRLRGIPSPARRELLEGLTSALAQGELLGRGRVLAAALDAEMVGERRGRLARGTPRSGLGPHVASLLEALRLPCASDALDARGQAEPARLRLDPLRSELDRRRHVALQRLAVCGVPYAELEQSERGETLTVVWTVQWSPQAEAAIEIAGTRGVTLRQCAAGALRAARLRLQDEERWLPSAQLSHLEALAECNLTGELRRSLDELGDTFLPQAGLAELVEATLLVERIDRGHLPGCPRDEPRPGDSTKPGAVTHLPGDLDELRRELLAACLAGCEGLFGGEAIEDARALLELTRLLQRDEDDRSLGHGRLLWTLRRLADEATPLMQGAASGALVLIGDRSAEDLGVAIGSWIDGGAPGDEADGTQAFRSLAGRLRGVLAVAAPLVESHPSLLRAPIERLEQLEDDAFLRRLPALRDGFDVLSPAARGRLLEEIANRLELTVDEMALLDDDPRLLAIWAEADAAGREAASALFGDLLAKPKSRPPKQRSRKETAAGAESSRRPPPRGKISPIDRWRLVLGQQRQQMSPRLNRVARAIDELYGAGRGEGSRSIDGQGAGQEPGFVTAREWGEELGELFSERVRQEVFGRAAESGRSDVVLELDSEKVSPSVELLEQVLSLKGALPESHLPQLRRIVERVVAQLVEQLAVRVRPALTGLATPRPSRRPMGPLDLRRTVSANLRTTRMVDGEPQVIAEKLYFRTRARRSIDWRVILLVDVSGSMEPSVIYSAMMAAILSGIPAVSVNFATFSTEVIDLSGYVDDPLSLLLEISVGGGTHIAKAVRYAAELVSVPARTLLLLVSDFDEGWPASGLVGEVQSLVQSGVTALGLAALDDGGQPRFNQGIAQQVADVGMPVAALTPLELARWVGEKIR